MFLAGPAPLPGEYRFLALDELQRELPADAAERDAGRRRLREREPARRRSGRTAPGALHGQHRPPPRQLALRGRQSRRRRGLLDRRGAARRLRGARPRADAGARRAALHRARHRHRPLPVREHDAEGAATRRRARRGRRGRAQGLPGRLRERPVREAEAPRAGARAGAGVRGRRARRLVPASRRLRGGRRGRALLGGDHRLPARRRGRRHGRSDPRAASRRQPRRGGSHCGPRTTRSTSPRSRVPPAAAATARQPASRATTRSRRSRTSSAASSSPLRALRPPADAAEGPRAERDHPGRQAGRAVVVRDRRACSVAHRDEDGPCGNS